MDLSQVATGTTGSTNVEFVAQAAETLLPARAASEMSKLP
jgi:hypothetical protein